MATYRLIQFIPDLFLQSAYTIGAVVEARDSIEIVLLDDPMRVLPANTSPGIKRLLSILIEELKHVTRVPRSLSPQLRVTEQTILNDSISPAPWLRQHLFQSQNQITDSNWKP
jgi:hypothetical protein